MDMDFHGTHMSKVESCVVLAEIFIPRLMLFGYATIQGLRFSKVELD
jgi:hypothetical protein